MDNTGKEIIDVGKALLKDIFSQNWMEISIVCIVVLIFILITLFSIILLLISIVERNFRDITKNIVLSLYSVIGVCWILKAFSMGASDIVTFAPLFLITILYSIKKQAGSWRKIKQYPEEVKHD